MAMGILTESSQKHTRFFPKKRGQEPGIQWWHLVSYLSKKTVQLLVGFCLARKLFQTWVTSTQHTGFTPWIWGCLMHGQRQMGSKGYLTNKDLGLNQLETAIHYHITMQLQLVKYDEISTCNIMEPVLRTVFMGLLYSSDGCYQPI